MGKWIKAEALTGRFIIGRASAEKFSAVEGLARSARTARLYAAQNDPPFDDNVIEPRAVMTAMIESFSGNEQPLAQLIADLIG